MKAHLTQSPDKAPQLTLTLHDDEGPRRTLDALIDTAWPGELYLGHQALLDARRHPDRFQKSWQELDPEPVEGLLGRSLLPCWQGRFSLGTGPHVQLKVTQGLRGHSQQPRVGRAFLERFRVLLILDLEREDYQLLARTKDSG